MEKTGNNKKSIIKVCQSIIDPNHKVEVDLIGAGGTGSQVMQGLARMDLALQGLGHPGLHITAYDHDIVENSNLVRQLFSVHDLGENKAACLTSKINRFYGFAWDFKPKKYTTIQNANLIITCVDNVKARQDLHKQFLQLRTRERTNRVRYWMDFGNGENDGQVIIGSTKDPSNGFLKSSGDIGIPELDEPNVPSCGLAEALTKQDLMINPMIANAGLSMLWKMFRTLKVEYNALYLNLNKMKMNNQLIYKSK